jgi:hypothetical protein
MSEEPKTRRKRAGRNGNVLSSEYDFKEGNPGGPGRPPGSLEEFRRAMREDVPAAQENVRKNLKKGNLRAAELVYEHAWGKPTQPVEIGGTVTLRSAVVDVREWAESIGRLADFEKWVEEKTK